MPRSLRVLIADDHRLFADSLRLVLEDDDRIAVVDVAATGAEALRLARKLEPDVILMDVNMPQIDGIEATRRLRARGSTAAIILMTGADSPVDAYDAALLGATAFLRKTETIDAFRSVFFTLASLSAVLAPAVVGQAQDAY